MTTIAAQQSPMKVLDDLPPPPVKRGEIMEIVPTGIAKDDPYYKVNGFVIFLKKVPMERWSSPITVKVTAVKSRFAFAEYQDQRW